MSSIFGGVHFEGKPFQPSEIEKISLSMQWNELDNFLIHQHKNVLLGNASVYKAPSDHHTTHLFHDKSAKLFITADARIDNRSALFKKLNIDNLEVGDAHLILKSYQKYGEDCVKHLIGAFAFVIWDETKQQIFGARDQIGVKPFNYYFKNNLFLFGTQKKSILGFRSIQFELDFDHIVQTILKRSIENNATIYKSIKRLEVATSFTVNKDGIKFRKYWELDVYKETRYQNQEDYVSHFEELMWQATKDRMRNIHNIGAHMSGGLDSSGICGIAQAIAETENRSLHTLSYVLPEAHRQESDFEDEEIYIKDQLKFSGIKDYHPVTKIIPRTVRQKIELEVQLCDGFQRLNKINNEFEILEAARENNIDVVMSGFPGDELVTSFAYTYFLDFLQEGKYVNYFKTGRKLTSAGTSLMKPFMLNMLRGISDKNKQKINNWYGNKRRKTLQGKVGKVNHFFSPSLVKENDDLNNALFKNFNVPTFFNMPDSLRRYQKNKMMSFHNPRRMESEALSGLKFNVEYRYPLADIRLLEYVLSVPREQKYSKERNRLMYRNGMKKYLAPSIANRMNKSGSIKPMIHFFHPSLDPTFKELFEDLRNSGALNWMNIEKVQQELTKQKTQMVLKRYMVLGSLISKYNIDQGFKS